MALLLRGYAVIPMFPFGSMSSLTRSLAMKLVAEDGQGVLGLAKVLDAAMPERLVVGFSVSELPTFHPPRVPVVGAVRVSLSQTSVVGVRSRIETLAVVGRFSAIFPVSLSTSGGTRFPQVREVPVTADPLNV